MDGYELAGGVDESVETPARSLRKNHGTDLLPDTLRHRITERGNGQWEWEWTRRRLAIMLRTEPRWVPEEWLY